MNTRVADVVGAVHEAFPREWAETWDRVGLLAGDPDAPVSRVLVSLDPTPEALERAREADVQVLVTHHPAFLQPAESMTPSEAGVVFSSTSSGIALVAAHTNLDRAPAAAVALPSLLGLGPGTPLENANLPVSLVTVFVPPSREREVAAAMSDAGAGRIGEYRGCSFITSGTGRFTPSADTDPYTGDAGTPSAADEYRLEMVAPRHLSAAVVAAVRDAHPYEEPLIVTADAMIARGDARMGRVTHMPEPTTLHGFVAHAARVFGITPRVWGDRDSVVSSVATATGSAGSLVPAALRSGVDVLLAGEVRYHDAQAAAGSGLCVVEIGHDVSEWPLVPVLAEAVVRTPGLDAGAVLVDPPAAGWWTP